jgi:hypothetical protein
MEEKIYSGFYLVLVWFGSRQDRPELKDTHLVASVVRAGPVHPKWLQPES